jgi:hypothetical protein
MPTKRFVWKDRDTAALDLIQLVYHAPYPISLHALDILSAIRSPIITVDLKEIVLDPDYSYWERIYALRALGNVLADIYFPELAELAEEEFQERQWVIAETASGHRKPYFHEKMLGDVIGFVGTQPSNNTWLFEALDQADPLVVCNLLSEQLSTWMPPEMTLAILHRLISLLNTHPHLLNLDSVSEIYRYADDPEAKRFLEAHLDVTIQLALDANPSEDSIFEIAWESPIRWPKLRAALIRARPDFEEKIRRHDEYWEAQRREDQEIRREDFSYRETPIWRELENLYEQANADGNGVFWKLYKKTYDHNLSVPVRAAATYFFGKLNHHHYDGLAFLAGHSCDSWGNHNYFTPVRFEAGKALFNIASPEAWEILISTYLVGSSTFLSASPIC